MATQLNEMRTLERRLRKQNAVVGNDAHRHAFNVRKTADQRGPKTRFEFGKLAAVHNARNDFAHVVGFAAVSGNHAIDFLAVVQRCCGFAQLQLTIFLAIERTHRLSRQCQRMRIVLCQMIGHARQARVHIAATQIFCTDHFACSRFDQRGATQEDGALVFNNDGFVAHGWHVSTAGSATAHDHRYLRNAQCTHVGLVKKDAPKVIAVWKHVVLVGQVGAARIDQVNARQVVLLRHFLRTQMLLDGHGVIGAALDGGVVAHNHAVDPIDAAYAGNHAGARCVLDAFFVQVHGVGRQGCQLQEGRARVKQHLHTFARWQLAAGHMFGSGFFATTCCRLFQLHAKVIDDGLQCGGVGQEIR